MWIIEPAMRNAWSTAIGLVLLLTTAAAVFLRLYRHAGGRKPRERAVTSLVHLAEDSR